MRCATPICARPAAGGDRRSPAPGGGWSESPGTVRVSSPARPFPWGADRVVIQENVARDGNVAVDRRRRRARRGISARAVRDFPLGGQMNCFRRADFSIRGRWSPRQAADVGRWLEVVRRPPGVHILSTGDELAGGGARRGERAQYNPGKRFKLGIAALVADWGSRMRQPEHVACADELAGRWKRRPPRRVSNRPIWLVVTGGASVGRAAISPKKCLSRWEPSLFFPRFRSSRANPCGSGAPTASWSWAFPATRRRRW